MTDENKALVVPPQPGELMATKANEMAKAMIEFLPGGNTLPEATRQAMAMLAVNNGLDPFLGEVYAVPQKRKNERTGTWEIVGYALGIGRGGWLRNAERSGLYQGNEFRFCTPEEEAAMGVQKGDVAMCCNVFKAVSSVRHSGNYRVSGFGIVGVDEKSKMNHFQLSRKRAFVDALRNAFPMAVPKVNGEQMQVRVVDDETGEILGNGHDLARECEPTAPLLASPARIESENMRDTKATLSGILYPPQDEAQAGEFTEAAPASETAYQPEGMPVVEAANIPFDTAVIPASERPVVVTYRNEQELCDLAARWLPRYRMPDSKTVGNAFAIRASIARVKIPSLSDPRVWPHLCMRNDAEGGKPA
jgi:hypothetical protein